MTAKTLNLFPGWTELLDMGKGKGFIGKGLLAMLAASVLFLTGCGDLTAVEDAASRLDVRDDGQDGAVIIRVSLGSVALAKKADTNVTLDTLRLVLTSPGCAARVVNVPVSGNINASSLVLTTKVTGLNPLRNWKLTASSRDLSDSVLHSDSTTFYVKPADTANVSMLMMPRYSVLVARFISTNKTKVDKIEKLVLRVNGAIVDDTTFSGKKEVFDVKLSHKYLKAGASTTISLEALDRASPARVRYSQDLTFIPRMSGDSTLTISLD